MPDVSKRDHHPHLLNANQLPVLHWLAFCSSLNTIHDPDTHMPFSSKQIQSLAIIVRQAWDLQTKLDLIEYPGDLKNASKTDKIDFFRRTRLHESCGKSSFKDCHAIKDYLLAKSYFQRLAGISQDAESTRVRQEYGAASTHTSACSALRQIEQAASEAGLSPSYIAKICFNKFGGETDIRQLSEKQLWHLCYTIRNRAMKKSREK